MDAGKLRHYVTIQTYAETSAGSRGEKQGGWQDALATVPAEIVTLTGRELELARQIIAQASVRIRLRYHVGVTTKSRIVWNGRVFNVVHVNNVDQRNRELVCLCSEGAA